MARHGRVVAQMGATRPACLVLRVGRGWFNRRPDGRSDKNRSRP